MFKNLNCELLGLSGRQSEIFELALTYGFQGIDIDISDIVKRCQRGSFESATRFLTSSKLRVGNFLAPVDLDADDETYAKQVAMLNGAAEIANRADARVAILNVPFDTDRLPYPEYFEVIRKRVEEIAAIFAKEDVKAALSFTAVRDAEENKQFKFVQDVEGFVALAKSCKSVGIVFDSFHWFCGKGDQAALESLGTDRVLAVRLADCVEEVAAEAATLNDCLLPASTDVIDNVGYLKLLHAAGVDVAVSAMGRLAEPGGTRDAFIGKTRDALDKVFEDAGLPNQTRKPETFVPESSYANHS